CSWIAGFRQTHLSRLYIAHQPCAAMRRNPGAIVKEVAVKDNAVESSTKRSRKIDATVLRTHISLPSPNHVLVRQGPMPFVWRLKRGRQQDRALLQRRQKVHGPSLSQEISEVSEGSLLWQAIRCCLN